MSEIACPTFMLPPCAACSHRGALERPIWKFAHNTSAKRKRHCYFFIGCRHAAEVAAPGNIWESGDWGRIEAAWKEKADRIFLAQTEKWPRPQATAWAHYLSERATLYGATDTMQFTPE